MSPLGSLTCAAYALRGGLRTSKGEHDGRIVADIIAECAVTHREPFCLNLTGPASGASCTTPSCCNGVTA